MTLPINNLAVEELLTVNSLQLNSTNTTTILNGTLILTALSRCLQFLSGSATGFSVVLPAANTLGLSVHYVIANDTNQLVTVKDGSGVSILTIDRNSIAYLYVQDNTTIAGNWFFWQVLANSIASGIINYNITSSTAFITSSRNPTFVPITGLNVTPQAGTYACWYNASVYYTTTPKAHFWVFYKNGTQVVESLRQQDTAHSNQTMVDTTQAVLSFNGSETCSVRVACDNTGSLTVNARTMVLIRIGS